MGGYKTIGVRALVIRGNKILLVQHTYLSQWYHPGGAVEHGETPRQAVLRELAEEVNIECTTLPRLFNVYYNRREQRDDYIVFYIVDDCTLKDFNMDGRITSSEIAQMKWFDMNSLPNDISPATLRRIEEYSNIKPLSENW